MPRITQRLTITLLFTFFVFSLLKSQATNYTFESIVNESFGDCGSDEISNDIAIEGFSEEVSFAWGLTTVCVDINIVDASVSDLDLYLIDPLGNDWTLAFGGLTFPNGGNSLTNTCFTVCDMYEDATTTNDVSPYTSTYNAFESFTLANDDITSINGTWTLESCAFTFGSDAFLYSWTIDFGPRVPLLNIFPQEVEDASCPGEADGTVTAVVYNGYCFPQMYSLDGENYVEDSIFTNVPAGDYTLWAINGNGVGSGINVTVFDDDFEDPDFFDCPDDIIVGTSTTDNDCEAFALITDPTPFDNCSALGDLDYVTYYDYANGTESQIFTGSPGTEFSVQAFPGINIAYYDVTDEAGNNFVCTQTIEVIDDTPPEWVNQDLEITVFGQCGVDIAEDLAFANIPEATDNCDAQEDLDIVLSGATSGLDCGGNASHANYFFTAFDTEGNASDVDFTVIVILEDTDPPMLNGVPPSNTIWSCLDGPPEFPEVTANDVCDGDLTDLIVPIIDAQVGPCEDGSNIETYIYNWSVTDFCGNEATASYTLTITNDFSIDLGPDILICDEPFVTLDAGVPGANYNWSTGETTQTIDVSLDGIYSVEVTTAGGCCAMDEVELIEGEIPQDVVSTGGELDCNGNDIQLTASSSTAFVTYDWSGPGGFTSSEQNPFVSEAGTYTVTITSTEGCTAISEATVTINTDAPNAEATGGSITCDNTTVQLSGSSTTPGVTYSWTGPNSFESDEQNPEVSEPGTYTLTVTAPNACVAVANAVVEANNNSPVLSANADTLSCELNSVQINLNSDDPNASYSWTGPNSFSSSDQNPTVSSAGTYSVVATGENGCTASLDVVVEQDADLPMATAVGGAIDCNVSSVQLMGSSSEDGSTYSWTGPNSFASGDQNPTVSEAGSYMLTVTAPNGCTAVASTTVDSDMDPPNIGITVPDTITCTNPMVQLQGSSMTDSVTYSWTGPDEFSSDEETPMVSVGGTYTLTLTGENGCTIMSSIVVETDNDDPDANAVIADINCENLTYELEGRSFTSGASFSWSGPNGFSSTEKVINVNEVGDFILSVEGDNGCVKNDTAKITEVLTSIVASVDTEEAIEGSDGKANVMISGGKPPYNILWSNGDTTEAASDFTVGPHNVRITDANDCELTVPFDIISLPTVCDFPATYVEKGITTSGTLVNSNPILASLFAKQCIDDAFPGVDQEDLFIESYLYFFAGFGIDSVTLKILDGLPGVKAFIFECGCNSIFCMQECLAETDENGEYKFDGATGYYYIVFVSEGQTDYEFILEEDTPSTAECEVDQKLDCNSINQLTSFGVSNFSAEDVINNVYGSGYNGQRSYNGPDQVYSFFLDRPQRVTFEISSPDGSMGLFVYNFQCGQTLRRYIENSDGGGESGELFLPMPQGTHYIIVDQEEMGSKDFTLSIKCVPFGSAQASDRPSALFADGIKACEPVDSSNSHQITIRLDSSSVGGRPLDPGDKIFFFTKKADNTNQIVGSALGYEYRAVGEEIPVTLYGDDPSDETKCGFEEGDEFVIKVKRDGEQYIVSGLYAPINEPLITAQGTFKTGGKSLITALFNDPNAQPTTFYVDPPTINSVYNSVESEFNVKSNKNWQIVQSQNNWIKNVGVPEDTFRILGINDELVRIEMEENEDPCRSRRDTTYVVLKQDGTLDFFVLTQEPPRTEAIALIKQPNPLGCGVFQIELNANNSARGIDFQIEWSTTDGKIINTNNVYKPVVEGGGTYQMIITDVGSTEMCADTAVIILDELEELEVDTDTDNSGKGIANVSGGLPPYSYQWSTGDSTQTTNDVLDIGTYMVTVTDATGCEREQTLEVTMVSTFDIGLNELISIFPNPSNGVVYLQYQFETTREVEIRITDFMGKTVFNKKPRNRIDETEMLNLHHLNSGVYIVEMMVDDKFTSRKIIVDR